MRIIPTSVHGVLDYLVGVLLILAPWLFDFDHLAGPAVWVPVAVGAATIGYSLITNYELGLLPVIAMPGHLVLDFLGGAFLALSPLIFGFSDFVWIPHVVVGLVEMGTALTTRTMPLSLGTSAWGATHRARGR